MLKQIPGLLDRFAAWLEAVMDRLHLGRLAQFVKFGLVGICNTFVHLAIYYLTYNLLGWNELICNAVAFAVSVTNAYWLNCVYVFRKQYTRKEHAWAYLRTVASYGMTGLVLNSLLLLLWINVCGISANIAPLINMLFTIPLNFVLNKWFAFRAPTRAAESAVREPPADEPRSPLQSGENKVE